MQISFKVIILWLFFSASFAHAQETSSNSTEKQRDHTLFSSTAPITIQADQVKIINKGQKAIYSGNVLIKQLDLLIKGNKIELEREDGQMKRLEIRGDPVNIFNSKVDKSVAATATHVVYNIVDGWLVLRGGSPELSYLGNRVSGKIIRYNTQTQDIDVQGFTNKPALLVIDPE